MHFRIYKKGSPSCIFYVIATSKNEALARIMQFYSNAFGNDFIIKEDK